MPKRYGKAERQVRGMAKYANLFAKQYSPDATGVIIHAYRRGTPASGYGIEVIAADGTTIGVYTIGHVRLMAVAERAKRGMATRSSTNMRCTECIFEHYSLEGDDVCIALFCSRCGQPRVFTK